MRCGALFLHTIAVHCWAFEVEECEIGAASLLQVDLRVEGRVQAENKLEDEVFSRNRSNASFEEKPANLSMGLSSPETNLLEKSVHSSGDAQQICDSSPASVWPTAWLAIGSVAYFCILFWFGRLHADKLCEADRPQRDHFSDHVKFITMGFVVFFHICLYDMLHKGFSTPATSIETGLWMHPACKLKDFARNLMMPTFVLYSGVFSRSFAKSTTISGVSTKAIPVPKLRAVFMNILLVGVIMNFIFQLIQIATNNSRYDDWYLVNDASGTSLGTSVSRLLSINGLWFIPALVAWRLFAPFWETLKYPVTFSFIVALIPLLAVYDPDYELPQIFRRIFGFFPFFAVGLQFDNSQLDKILSDRRLQVAGLICLIAGMIMLHVKSMYLFVSVEQPFQDIAAGKSALLWDLTWYPVAFITTASFLAASKPLLSGSWGPVLDSMCQRTLYVYAGHFSVLTVLSAPIREDVWDPYVVGGAYGHYLKCLTPWMQVLFGLVLSFSIVLFLSSWPVYFILSSICEPKLEWIFKDQTFESASKSDSTIK